MAKINEKNAGTLTSISVEMSTNMEIPGATISYHLRDDSNELQNVISFGNFKVDDEFYNAHSTDKQFILNWVIEQLGVVIVD